MAAALIVASASLPQAVAITATEPLGDFNPGSFTASGGITDSGVYQLLEDRDVAVPSPIVGTSHFIFSLAGIQGTIILKGETVFRLVSAIPLILREDGSWLIVDGTGAYAELSGEGQFHKLVDVSLVEDRVHVGCRAAKHVGTIGS